MRAKLRDLDSRIARRLHLHEPDERGIIIPLTATMMVILLAFTAFAVDLGILYNERRQDQSAVDNGALSGGRVMIGDGATDQVFADIASVSYANLASPPFTEDEWWSMIAGANGEADCLDPDAALAGFPDPLELDASVTAPGGTSIPAGTDIECISFDDGDNPARIRVHLPLIDVESVFAQVVGIDGFQSSAFAEVGISNPRDVGGVLPFAIAAASVSLAEVCLKADSNTTLPQCDGGTTGNYGRLDLGVWGFLNADEDCAGSGNADQPLAINTAQGLDHYLATSLSDSPSPVYTEVFECNTNKDDDPNETQTQTGNAANGFNAGLIGFDGEKIGSADLPAGLQGRLMGINPKLDAIYQPGVTNTQEITNDHRVVDSVPLWTFLTPTLKPGTNLSSTVPIRCLPGTFATFASKSALDSYLTSFPGLTTATFGTWTSSLTYPWNGETEVHLRDCFNDYNGGILVPPFAGGATYTTTLFGRDSITGDNYIDDDGASHTVFDIEYSHRFAWMPVIWTNTFPNGNSKVHFRGFQPVWVQTLFGKCNGNPVSCNFQHSPGQPLTTSKMPNADLGAASAMSIQLTMLPTDVQDAQQQKLLDDPPVRLIR